MASALAVLAEEWFRVDRVNDGKRKRFSEEIEDLQAGSVFYLLNLFCCLFHLILGLLVLPFQHGKTVVFTPVVIPVLTAVEKTVEMLLGAVKAGKIPKKEMNRKRRRWCQRLSKYGSKVWWENRMAMVLLFSMTMVSWICGRDCWKGSVQSGSGECQYNHQNVEVMEGDHEANVMQNGSDSLLENIQ